jgi:hypothetical protein
LVPGIFVATIATRPAAMLIRGLARGLGKSVRLARLKMPRFDTEFKN